MDIGVASVRNIYKIHWRRSLLWVLLALSSVPIHLLYNSAIFKVLDTNEYMVFVVHYDFLQGGVFASPTFPALTQSGYNELLKIQHSFTNGTASSAAEIDELTNSDCIAAYGTSFVSGRRNLLAVTGVPGNQTNNTVFKWYSAEYDLGSGKSKFQPYDWICIDLLTHQPCDVAAARLNATNWTLGGKQIYYCLTEVLPSNCKLQFSVYILVIVILMNACESLAMFLTLYNEKDATLVTIGMKAVRPI